MGGITTIASTDFELTYFTEAAAAPSADRVTAVVAWRGGSGRSESHGRALRRWVAARLRPSRRPPDPPDRPDRRAGWQLPAGWNGASDGGGRREVLHSAERRAVRVAGGEYALPADGRTLVLLVDDRAGAGQPAVAVTVSEHAVTIPPHPSPRLAAGLSQKDFVRLSRETGDRTRRAVLNALRDDPAVRAFLPASAWDAA